MAISTVPGNHTETAAEAPVYTLNSLHRCDTCGAQAYLRVFLENGDLLFCGNHYKRYEAKLIPLFIKSPIDERSRLIQDKTKGSEHS